MVELLHWRRRGIALSFGHASCRLPAPVAQAGSGSFPVDADRWFVLFANGRHPLWLPRGDYAFQKCCLRYFIANPYKALYARTLLCARKLVRGALSELLLPREIGSLLAFNAPISAPRRAAIQVGTPGPYQKATILLASAQGGELAFAKVAMAAGADARIAMEAAWLGELARVRQLAGRVPRLVAEGHTTYGRRYLVTTPAPGTRQSRTLSPAHVRFLAVLGRVRIESVRFTDSQCYRDLERALAVLGSCTDSATHAALASGLRDCATTLDGWVGPFVIAQGDFAPWNVRLACGDLFVFDWEYAQAGANPLSDVLDFLLLPQAVRGRLVTARAFASVIREAAECARQLYPEWSWSHPVIPALALAYLLRVTVHYSLANGCVQRTDPVVRNYWQLMEKRSAWLGSI